MPKYQLIYEVSNDNLRMDISTGFCIDAANKKKALNMAKRLDQILIDFYKFRVHCEPLPHSHIEIMLDGADSCNEKPQIIKYKVLELQSDDCYKQVSSREFHDELERRKDIKDTLVFNVSNYGVLDFTD